MKALVVASRRQHSRAMVKLVVQVNRRGYQRQVRERLGKIAHQALDQGTTLKKAALSTGWIDEQTFDRVVDPKRMVHPDN